MAEKFPALTEEHVAFIRKQFLFFVGTAGAEGHVNVSPKGMDTFRITHPSEVIWLNLTGSGNESAAHVLENGRMTVMFCSFDKQPLIMRLYGQASVIHPRDDDWTRLIGLFPDHAGARQIFRHPTCGAFERLVDLRDGSSECTFYFEPHRPNGPGRSRCGRQSL